MDLPDGPCPQKANNRSVKPQGDLMLCPKCDAIRFPPTHASNAALQFGVTVQKRATIKMVDDRITEFSEVREPNNTSDETDAVAHDQPDNASSETPVVSNTVLF